MVNIHCLLEGGKHLVCTLIFKLEPVSFFRRRVILHDRIVQTAGRPDHGYCPVFQTVHLVQPARFINRRHKKDVRPCFYEMGKAVVKAYLDAHPAVIAGSGVLYLLFIRFIPAAEQYELKAHGYDSAHCLKNEIDALLLCEPCYHTDYRGRTLIEIEHPVQGHFIVLFHL